MKFNQQLDSNASNFGSCPQMLSQVVLKFPNLNLISNNPCPLKSTEPAEIVNSYHFPKAFSACSSRSRGAARPSQCGAEAPPGLRSAGGDSPTAPSNKAAEPGAVVKDEFGSWVSGNWMM